MESLVTNAILLPLLLVSGVSVLPLLESLLTTELKILENMTNWMYSLSSFANVLDYNILIHTIINSDAVGPQSTLSQNCQ